MHCDYRPVTIKATEHHRATMARCSVTWAYMLFCIFSMATLAVAKKDLHFIYYGFETRTGPNTSIVLAAGKGAGSPLSNLSAAGFGSIFVFDNLLRTGPTNDSEVVGHYTGTAVAASLEPIQTTGGVLLTAELIFYKGSQYEGSRITTIGTVATADPPEYKLLVLGGFGHFLGCTGYALSHRVLPAVLPVFVFEWEFFLKC